MRRSLLAGVIGEVIDLVTDEYSEETCYHLVRPLTRRHVGATVSPFLESCLRNCERKACCEVQAEQSRSLRSAWHHSEQGKSTQTAIVLLIAAVQIRAPDMSGSRIIVEIAASSLSAWVFLLQQSSLAFPVIRLGYQLCLARPEPCHRNPRLRKPTIRKDG